MYNISILYINEINSDEVEQQQIIGSLFLQQTFHVISFSKILKIVIKTKRNQSDYIILYVWILLPYIKGDRFVWLLMLR